MSAELTTRRYSLFFSPTVLMVSVILAGCGDVPQPDDMVGPRNAIVETGIADSQLQGLHLGERHFVDMATTEPSFAGLFVEAGKVVLLATNVARSAELVGVFEAYRDELQLSQPIEVRPAAYSFVDLANWRNLALRHHSRDWIAVDLDERANRISIAVTGEDAERRIRDGLTARGVPPEVLWFEVEQPPRPGSKDVVALFDDPPPYVFSRKDRPVPAGYRITTADNGTQITECTMGFVARRKPSGQSVFATASHCTDALFSLDSTEV